ncbi:MAG: winged helix-turn-helix domain-containing protein [Chloroflexota bacterium]|mgnify:CR=1 FL=1
MPEWAFLTNHALVLSFIAHHPRITARDLSLTIGITERTTRKIIANLQEAGYIVKKREGRRIRYRVNPRLSLRHPVHGETAVGDLLNALGWRKRGRPFLPINS